MKKATTLPLEDKSISTGFLEASCEEMENRRSLEWNQFYEKELDALQWAKEFMDNYERKHRKRLERVRGELPMPGM